jgi:hypothetical protein
MATLRINQRQRHGGHKGSLGSALSNAKAEDMLQFCNYTSLTPPQD